MTREWQPGDVAMVTCSDGKERVAICGKRYIDDSLVWLFRDHTLRDVDNSTARPLVIIDAEDRGQVERLCKVIVSHASPVAMPSGQQVEWRVSDVQAALREFADPTPPKPAEPTGLGAVVEDANGGRWVQVGRRGDWYQAHGKWSQYGSIAAVRVLSEGIQ